MQKNDRKEPVGGLILNGDGGFATTSLPHNDSLCEYAQASTTEKSTLARAFSYILSEQNAYIHIKNLGKNRE